MKKIICRTFLGLIALQVNAQAADYFCQSGTLSGSKCIIAAQKFNEAASAYKMVVGGGGKLIVTKDADPVVAEAFFCTGSSGSWGYNKYAAGICSSLGYGAPTTDGNFSNVNQVPSDGSCTSPNKLFRFECSTTEKDCDEGKVQGTKCSFEFSVDWAKIPKKSGDNPDISIDPALGVLTPAKDISYCKNTYVPKIKEYQSYIAKNTNVCAVRGEWSDAEHLNYCITIGNASAGTLVAADKKLYDTCKTTVDTQSSCVGIVANEVSWVDTRANDLKAAIKNGDRKAINSAFAGIKLQNELFNSKTDPIGKCSK